MHLVKIVYIEDNISNMTLVRKIIDLVDSIEMVGASTGGEGIELVRSTLPDIVLLDINLPDMDGFSVLRTLKEDSSTERIPVVALTASATRAEVLEGRKLGFDRYLTKPFNIKEFLDLLSNLAPTAEALKL
ncbi:hypothetical protein BST95_07615 [Halioglobus japonicus]|uniref:Response regulator n=1 Tax=Halioglobus japonicus TaxID=930805 RepID=A0AAP8ME22_9GAMM|nr:response regulator [Halioglobus japonicus]AQA18128.1 hypothetical protein BST95_07615 [Halioglobus japonicus]PLW86123.1 response regulator [Halioglobus japonicus]GHD14359.1 hypothetical protein GCM10007052_18000 [Halioglobus japonicus]